MVDLFGGAIVAPIPPTWRDVSQVRQVPDNQEVYQDCAEETGAVLVIEILEYQRDVSNENACSFFLKDLADANDVPLEEQHIHSSQILNLLSNDDDGTRQLLPNFALPTTTDATTNDLYACISGGRQKVVQGKKGSTNDSNDTAHWIDVEMFVLRLKNVETDILISLSAPHVENISDGKEKVRMGEYSTTFKSVLAGFNIRDWSLFG